MSHASQPPRARSPSSASSSASVASATHDYVEVDYDRDFRLPWWSEARGRGVGETIARALARRAPADARATTSEELARALVLSGEYGADVRAAVKARTRARGGSWRAVARAEDACAEAARAGERDAESSDGEVERRDDAWSWSRIGAVGAGAVVGGAALFLSGGMAAPAVLSALGGMGAVGAGAAGVVGVLGGVSAVFGATGAGLAGYAMARRTSTQLERFQFVPLRGAGRAFALHIFVPGFLRDEKDLLSAWGSEANEYVIVINESGALGMTLDVDAEGHVIVESFCESASSKAKEAGVLAGSRLISYRSRRPSVGIRKRDKSFSSKNKVPSLVLEEMEALQRPLELRLALAPRDAFSDKIDSMIVEMREAIDDTESKNDDDAQESTKPKRKWSHSTGEQYVLDWEPSTLIELGAAMDFMGGKFAAQIAAPSILAQTALASIASAIMWPVTLLSMANFLDNPWQIARNKAEIAGAEIARALLKKQHGQRPVTLVAYSAGAYVVQSTLMKLHAAGPEGMNIIDSVVLISAPLSNSAETWAPMREVVSGRLVNVYSPDDWMLMFFYRLKSVDTTLGLAGLQPVARDDVHNVMVPSLKHVLIPDEMSTILTSYVGVEE